MTGRIIRFPSRPLSSEQGLEAADRLLQTDPSDRLIRSGELQLEEPEMLLALSTRLRSLIESSPERGRDEAAFIYRFLEKPKRAIGVFDERDYFLGEFALIAGTACRFMFLCDEARRWFDRAESNFRHTVNAVSDWARVGYQRLALKMEERHCEEVLELLPSLVDSFRRLEMPEEALKCRFLEGAALKELGRLPEALAIFVDIRESALAMGAEKLIVGADASLIQLHAALGQPAAALRASREAVPLVRKLGNRVALGKLQWGIGDLFREQRDLASAVGAYREAKSELGEIGMRGDVAALHLVIADLLLELDRTGEATAEIGAALPIIEELKMVPEGVAALTLLRESLRHRTVNRQALRDLHGYFEETAS